MNVMQDLSSIAPIWIPGIAAAAVLLLAVAGGYKRRTPVSGTHLATLSLAALGVAAWLLANHEGTTSAFGTAIILDGVSVVFGVTALVGAFLATLLSVGFLKEHGMAQGEYYALVLLSTVGMLILAMAGDLLILFIGIETMSLGVYVLAGYARASPRSQEAALKYFVYGAFASAFVLFGIALIYGEVGRITGTPGLAFAAVREAFAGGSVGTLGWVAVALVLAGLAFKVAAVPFHMWTPDVYEGAPTPSTGFMAVGVKAGAFAGLCRFVAATLLAPEVSENLGSMVQALEWLAILSMVLGNLVAIRQTRVKRMLAYSSIAHAGYILVGVTALVSGPSSAAMEGMGYYLFGYTAMTLGAFGVVIAFERKEDRRLDIAIDRFKGVGLRHPALGLAMALFMFSLAGVPPSAGFFGKLAVFSSAVEAGLVGLVIVAVIASAVGAYYYLRVLVVMYMSGDTCTEQRISSRWLTAGLWGCAALTLVVGILPEHYLGFAKKALMGWLP